MQFVVPALHAAGRRVGDTAPPLLPAHVVASPTHLLDELLPAACPLHDQLDSGDELELPALSPHSAAVLSCPQSLGAMLLLIRLQRCESMFPADLVADQPHPLQRPRREAQLLPGVRLDGVDDEVGVEVCRIDVGRHQHLAAGEEFLSQLQRDLMSLLRADLLLRRERLDVLVEEGPGCFVVEVLGRHESIAGQICHAIDAGEVSP